MLTPDIHNARRLKKLSQIAQAVTWSLLDDYTLVTGGLLEPIDVIGAGL